MLQCVPRTFQTAVFGSFENSTTDWSARRRNTGPSSRKSLTSSNRRTFQNKTRVARGHAGGTNKCSRFAFQTSIANGCRAAAIHRGAARTNPTPNSRTKTEIKASNELHFSKVRIRRSYRLLRHVRVASPSSRKPASQEYSQLSLGSFPEHTILPFWNGLALRTGQRSGTHTLSTPDQ